MQTLQIFIQLKIRLEIALICDRALQTHSSHKNPAVFAGLRLHP